MAVREAMPLRVAGPQHEVPVKGILQVMVNLIDRHIVHLRNQSGKWVATRLLSGVCSSSALS